MHIHTRMYTLQLTHAHTNTHTYGHTYKHILTVYIVLFVSVVMLSSGRPLSDQHHCVLLTIVLLETKTVVYYIFNMLAFIFPCLTTLTQ